MIAARTSPIDLVDAIVAVSPHVPESFLRFEALATDAAPYPDFTEHSVRFGETLDPHRLTHYFDVPSGDPGPHAREATLRFARIADALGHPLTDGTRDLLTTWLPAQPDIAQVVLGIDAQPAPGRSRTKLYVVLRSPAPDLVMHLCDALGQAVSPGLEARQVYLVGVDLDESGVSDVKLYMRLDLKRIHRTIRNLEDVRALIGGARSVVLQQCLASARRQLHFHATDDRIYLDWLTGRARVDDATDRALAHVHAVDARLRRGRLGPWIVGLPYEDGRVRLDRGNLYLHVSDEAR